MYLRTKYICL